MRDVGTFGLWWDGGVGWLGSQRTNAGASGGGYNGGMEEIVVGLDDFVNA